MPITKSAKKSLKVSRVKQAQNYKAKVLLDKALKNVDEKKVNQTVSTIDKAAKIGIIHKNKAARLKSALSKKFGTPARNASSIADAGGVKETAKTVTKPVKKAIEKKAVAKKPAKKSK